MRMCRILVHRPIGCARLAGEGNGEVTIGGMMTGDIMIYSV